MILLGDTQIPYERIEKIATINDIQNSSPNSTVLFKYNVELLKHCHLNDLSSAVIVSNIVEAIYSNALRAKYIICEQNIAKTLQDIAETYMFDSKIITIICEQNEIENIALMGIDGIIYKDFL